MQQTRSTKSLPYLERDISWMYFNKRILQEAQRPTVPVLERMSFLGIYSNNLDEFYRVRYASLRRIAASTDASLRKESENARQTLKRIGKLNSEYADEFAQTMQTVREECDRNGIHIIDETQLDETQMATVEDFFLDKLYGSTVPIWLSKIDDLVSGYNEELYMAVKATAKSASSGKEKCGYAVIRLPAKECGRFLRLPDREDGAYIIFIDDVLRVCLPKIFAGSGYEKFEGYALKFTKDAEMDIDNTDMVASKLQKVQIGIKSRKNGQPMRVIMDKDTPLDLRKRIHKVLKIDDLDTMLLGGRYQNHKDLMSFPDCGRKDLKYPAWPQLQKKEFSTLDSVLDLIRRQDLLIHVPYYSFDGYLRFLNEAAIDPKVKSIKITLYRLARDSKVISALIAAARNGKAVTVCIELLARFDEENNIHWSHKLQEAGVDVIFGVEGLKVHSKLTLVESSEGSVVCIGSGNFHEKNARTYTDCMLFTADKAIVKDVENVFKFIKTPFNAGRYKELLVSPNDMKRKILAMIRTETRNAKVGKEAYIKAKINHVTDPDVVSALYAASKAGVRMDILLRGNSSLVTGVPGVSENIRCHGIIDRYLEHSRILIFCNGGDRKFYLGSADWMPRNLLNRIEVMTPVHDVRLQEELELIVDYGLRDTLQGRVADGSDRMEFYQGAPFRSQEELYKYYKSKQ